MIVLALGPKYGPVLLASYFLDSIGKGVPWLPSSAVAAAGLIRVLLGAAFIRRVSLLRKTLGPFEDIAGVFLAGTIATAAGAAIGVATLAVAGVLPLPWGVAFRGWWLTDLLAIFVTCPALLAILRSSIARQPKWSPWFALRLLLYFSSVALACYAVFLRPDTRYLLFSVFLLILIAAAWLGPTAARFAAVIISFAAICATRIGIGAFAAGNFPGNLQNMAFFLVAVSFTGMAVGGFRTIGNLTLPAGVLMAGWACSSWLYASLDLGRIRYDENRLQDVIASVEARINSGYRSYEDLSWNAAGLVAASPTISPAQWQAYLIRLRLPERYSEIETMTVVQPAEGGPAARASRDSGNAVLAREGAGSGHEPHFQMFIPVYRPGAPLATVAERRQAVLGYVSAEFRAGAFFREALAESGNIVDLRVSDTDGTLLFATGGPELEAQAAHVTQITLGGSRWNLVWHPTSGFPYVSRTPFALAAGCTALLSLLLAGLVLILQTTRRRASYRWKLLQSASALGTWELDLDSEEVQCSEHLLRLYGVQQSRERLSVAEWLEYVHPDDREAMLAGIREHLGKGQPFDWQYRVVWPDGSTHWLHSKALPVDEGEESRRMVGVDFDISEIRRLQSELAQAQKLQSVGQLAAGVAHEINTPIQYIGDNGKFLEDAFRDLIQLSEQHGTGSIRPEESAREVLDYLKVEVPKAASELLDGVNQVARIVRAMKEFSHPGAIETSAADLNRAIENTVLVSRAEWKEVAEVTTDLDPALFPVPCAVGEFNQVMLNLIVNAAHAIADVEKNSGRKGLIHISTRQKETTVEVRVSDTGGGVPEAIRSKIFDPFFTTKPVGKGTGQGLAIAHAVIVQRHNGSLTFESEPGRGTTFIIQLPIVRELEPA